MKIPLLVKTVLYLDYKKEYPNSPFKEDSLKERLRANSGKALYV
jgi:hypothetical protein